jgi:hypothetical protein
MTTEKQKAPKRAKRGRIPSEEKAEYRYSVNLTPTEHARFLTLFEESGVKSKAQFIAARIFNEEFRVVKTDRTMLEYVTKLSAFHAQFRAIGVNYNQIVKSLNSNFSEKKALAFLYKLEKATIELVEISRQIVQLSENFQRQWLQK